MTVLSYRPYGRPFSTFTPDLVDKLNAEYRVKPFNISARARELGVKRTALHYHLLGGKVARIMRGQSWQSAVRLAHQGARNGNKREVLKWLREAVLRAEQGKY